ncbi:MAG TPA: hypothetical protein PLU66_03625 [Trueperaceae bacterium]|nr:hypothetical protein [Trueperaceae bacterium]
MRLADLLEVSLTVAGSGARIRTHEHRVDADRVGATQQGADVARLLQADQHQDQRAWREGYVFGSQASRAGNQ